MSPTNSFDWVSPLHLPSKIVLTSFPGLNENKVFSKKIFLEKLRILNQMNCKVLLSLVEDIEFSRLCDKKFFTEKVIENGLEWHHLPIADYNVPDEKFFKEWNTLSPSLQAYLSQDVNICIHCMGGLGRSGTVGSVLLIELGESNKTVIERIRKHRKGAVENQLQENFVENYSV